MPFGYPYGGFDQYLLYEDGTFALQYGGDFTGELRGRYSWGNTNSTINFDFDANRPQWKATGTINGNSLSVDYNFIMGLDGFEDGVYRRAAAK